MPLFQRAAFFTTVAQLKDLPADAIAEVAFAGRSNAGKSSAINTLTGRSRLAYVSKTPGRTQHLNYFALGGGRYLVDLPGYGFAKTPDSVKKNWEWLVASYLADRAPLAGLALIMDCRRPLTEIDCQMMNWFSPTGRPMHLLLSKADKLSRQAQQATLAQVRAAVAPLGKQCSVQLFSSLKKTGVEECERVLAEWMNSTIS
ncbi:MAG: ribosome biogenesis GTP-binding protein YihA/YsxC [Zoogloeaceae bacterium]|jgi:GTP-binding protein|nr:ribosome biogenesis GTP-binding protein YihA/YsxC [Zoogloeaceae bacterium]